MAWAYSRVASLITKHTQAALARMKEICRYLSHTGPMAMRTEGRQSLTATNTSEAELVEAANADEALKAMYLVLAEMTG
eukprot:2411832-Amphidinium_carterae.1